MKRILILLVIISLIGCTIDDESQTAQTNYSAFLENRTPSLIGKLNSQSISWKFGWNEYQMSSGYENGNGICSTTDPIRILSFGLSTDDASTQLTFITPKMNTSNQDEVKSVLSIGKKRFGDIYNNFQFRILKNNNFYINTPNTDQKLEIVKTEEFQNYDNKTHMLVWIKIDNLELINSDQSGEKINLKDGLMIAEFNGHIFE